MENLIELEDIDTSILQLLLEDKTTGKNIIWATDSYAHFGTGYKRDKQILIEQIRNSNIIEPRIQKTIEVQKERTKKNAEVFTPAWICNQMNNQIDNDWLSEDSAFNTETTKGWITNREKVQFAKRVDWKKYVKNKVLEITCGEAPFLVSRYDPSTGEIIPVKDRIGFLDRKLRIVTENTESVDDWYTAALDALKSVYGYEFQGDSLLIGRINVLLTFIETMDYVWNCTPEHKLVKQIARIISWNLFQMDGLTACTPIGVPEEPYYQPTIFDLLGETEERDVDKASQVKINWWTSNLKQKISDMKEGKKMSKKWGVIIGNPPYQESDGGNNASAVPVYQKFINEASKLSDGYLSMIIPDRWFSGGRGLDQFREEMKNDDSIQYLYDYSNASDCFPGVDISGGICYFIKKDGYHGLCKFINHNAEIDPIKMRSLNEFPVVVRSNASVDILDKIKQKTTDYLSTSVSRQRPFGLRTFVKPDNAGDLTLRWNKGKGPIESSKITAGEEMVNKYKVIVSRVFFEHAGQAGKDGKYRVLSVLERLKPKEICTETYIVVDSFSNEREAINLEKYLKTKFARFLILQAASSIMITRNSFLFVPKLDFSDNGEIDWSTNINKIDNQLFSLFNLSDEEIRYINSSIKEME